MNSKAKNGRKKLVIAWAVLDGIKIARWIFTKADNHFDIYGTKKDALIARQEWEESSGEGFSVVKVEIRIVKPRKKP